MISPQIGAAGVQTEPAQGRTERGAGAKLAGLELLRFLSALSVLVWHYQHFSFVGEMPIGFTTARQPFYMLLAPAYRFGWLGVDVFWCISGFIFFWKYNELIRERKIDGRRFFVLRFSRLYPLHFVTLLAVAGLQWLYLKEHGHYFVYQLNDVRHFASHLFMASNWGFQTGYSFNGPVWSISIEVLVYVFFYFSVRYVSGSLAATAVVAILAFSAQEAGLDVDGLSQCLMFFYAGGLTAFAFKLTGRSPKAAAVASVLAVLGIVASGIVVLLVPRARNPYHLLLVCTPAAMFLLTRHLRLTAGVRRLVEIAGNTTYSSYLLHFPLQLIVMLGCSYAGIRAPMYDWRFFLGYIGLTLLLAVGIYRFFELPAQDLIRRRFLRTDVARRT